MEEFFINMISSHGVAGIMVASVFIAVKFIVKSGDHKIMKLENEFNKHLMTHNDLEKSICDKIDKLYERLNPMCDSVNRIQGYLEAKNVKNK